MRKMKRAPKKNSIGQRNCTAYRVPVKLQTLLDIIPAANGAGYNT